MATCNWSAGVCSEGTAATYACSDCSEHLCSSCYAHHGLARGTSAHHKSLLPLSLEGDTNDTVEEKIAETGTEGGGVLSVPSSKKRKAARGDAADVMMRSNVLSDLFAAMLKNEGDPHTAMEVESSDFLPTSAEMDPQTCARASSYESAVSSSAEVVARNRIALAFAMPAAASCVDLGTAEAVTAAFDGLDTDGDGALTLLDFEGRRGSAWNDAAARWAGLQAAMDENRDGQISKVRAGCANERHTVCVSGVDCVLHDVLLLQPHVYVNVYVYVNVHVHTHSLSHTQTTQEEFLSATLRYALLVDEGLAQRIALLHKEVNGAVRKAAAHMLDIGAGD